MIALTDYIGGAASPSLLGPESVFGGTLTTPASAGDYASIFLVGQGGIQLSKVFVNNRQVRWVDHWNVGTDGPPFASVAVGVRLEAGDDTFQVFVAGGWCAVGIFLITGLNPLPEDFALYAAGEERGSSDNLQAPGGYTTPADGIRIAGVVTSTTELVVPSGWDTVATVDILSYSVSIAATAMPAGLATTEVWDTGLVPVGALGADWDYTQVQPGLDVRPAGDWCSASYAEGPSPEIPEPIAPADPPERALPRVPPDPTAIEVPTPPWIERDGPYRP